jgi:hypothetical protein
MEYVGKAKVAKENELALGTSIAVPRFCNPSQGSRRRGHHYLIKEGSTTPVCNTELKTMT